MGGRGRNYRANEGGDIEGREGGLLEIVRSAIGPLGVPPGCQNLTNVHLSRAYLGVDH